MSSQNSVTETAPAPQPVQLVLPATRSGSPARPASKATTTRAAVLSALHPSGPHWRRFGPVWGTLSGATGTIAAAGLIDAVPLPLAVVGTVAGAGGAVVAGAARQMPGRRLLWRGACWLSAGSWSLWSAVTTPWGSWQLGTLAVASLGAGWVATAAEHRQRREAIARAQAAAEAEAAAMEAAAMALAGASAQEWADRIARVADIHVEVTGIQPWDNDCGYTVHLKLPPGGVTFQDLANKVVQLASDADLDVGCEITLRRGDTRRSVMLDVTTEGNALEKEHHLDDITERTINEDLDIGVLRNSEPARINLRFHCVAMAGQTDAGKSNQLQVLNARMAQCNDVVLWHIDLTGGNLSRAWVRPWYREKPGHEHPILDWVAANEKQAEWMLDAALAVIDGRRSEYDHVMEEAGDDKIPVSPQLPEIVIVIDEIHRLPHHLRKKLTDISDTGRGAAVRTVSCGLRAVDNYLPTSIVAQARVRIGMRVSDDKETNYLFGWREKVDPASMPYQGCGLLYQGEAGNESLVPFRGYRLAPPRIAEIVQTVQQWRPDLDSLSQRLADRATRGAYTRRWADTLPVLFKDAKPGEATPVPTEPEPARPTPAGQESPEELVDRIFNMNPEERRAQIQQGVAEAKRESELQKREDEADRAATELTLSDCGISTGDRLMSLIDDAGPEGIAIEELCRLALDHKIGSRATVYRNCKMLVHSGLIMQPEGWDTPRINWTRVIAARFHTKDTDTPQ